jgi:hypothetical protein
LPWLYIGEIFSNRTREVGVASGAASQWLFNFLMSQATPYALEQFGWRTFLLFGGLNYGVVAFAISFLKEVSPIPFLVVKRVDGLERTGMLMNWQTKGRSLEEMDDVFDAVFTGAGERRGRRKHRSSNDREARGRLIRED